MKAKLSSFAASALAGFVATALALSPQVLRAQDPQDGGKVTQTAGLLADGKGARPVGAPPRASLGLAGLANTTGNGINYHGGPVMLNTLHMYYIWYGTWDAASKTILTNFANGIGGSPYFNTNTTYFDSANNNVSNSVTYAGSTVDNYSRGKSLADADIDTIVSSALTSGRLPTDSNGVYFVLTSPDVNETSGFTTIYCAWHTWDFLNGANIKYAFIGNSSVINPGACSVQTTNSPNGNPGVDSMVSLVTHEFEESVTDPNLNAWWDSNGEETADKCAWTFGNVYTVANGSYANVNLGGHDFLIQQEWVNASGGYCALSYSATPDFSIAVSPPSQSVVQAATTGNYTVTVTPSGGFTGSVGFTVNGLPSGASTTPNPPASSTTSSAFTITTLATLTPGTYPFTITGTNASLSHTINASLIVTAAPDFSIAVAPTPQTVVQGGTTASYTVTVTPVNGFNGTVGFTVNGLPAGASTTPNPPTSSTTSSAFTITTLATLTPGTYPFTITGTNASLTHTINASLIVTAAPDFSIAVSPTPQTVVQGGTTSSYTVTVTPVNGFTGSVGFTVNGLPAGASTTPNPPTSSTTSSAFTITTLATLTPGTYPFTITGTNASLTHTINASLIVTAAPDFSIAVAPTPQTVVQGGTTGSYTVTVTPANGFTGSVGFTINGLPAGASTTPNPPTSSTTSSAFTITTLATLAPGTYPFTITGTNASLTHTINASLIVTATPDFSIAVAPTPQTVVQGGTTSSYTVTVTPVNGFTGSVGFTVNGLPAGASTTPNPPTSSTTSSAFTITTLATLTPGTYPFTITGTNASLTHTINASLIVTAAPDFSIAVAPTPQTVVQGGTTASYTVTVTPVNGFNGTVGFTVNGLPAGASTTPNPPTSSTTSSAFTITTLATLTPGTYPFTITGTNASLTHTINASLIVTAAPDFSIAVAPTPQTVVQGGTTSSYTVTVTPVNGFSGSVGFTVNGLPSGASATPNPPTASTTSSAFTITTLATLTPGTYPFTITGTNASLTHTINASLIVTGVVIPGSLLGSETALTTAANLTTEGTGDWVHWGDASLTRKAAVAAQLSSYTVVGGGSVATYANDPRPLSWTDGTPTVSSANDLKGIYLSGTGKGFSITAPADTTSRTLILHAGGWNSAGTLTAHLSDNSAPDFTNTTSAAGGQYDRNYTLTYQAGVPGQSLTVTWKMASGAGNVTLNGAALSAGSIASTTIAATGGAPQSTAISTAFLNGLQATVKDAGNNPVSGASVTFTAPASGASGTFISSGTSTVTVTTDGTGVATAPTFTANTTAGAYTVSASTPGAAASASFSLTNQPGPPATVAATSGTPQTTAVNTAFANPLVATVKDSSGNLVSGTPVTFTAPSAGAGGAFSAPGAGAVIAATVNSDSNGVATAPTFTANGSAGSYSVVPSTPGATTAAGFSLTNKVASAASVTATGGTSQSAKIGTAFTSPLVAVVKDSGGNLVSGAPVTFAVPGTGASGTFNGSATVTSDLNGVATAPALTANTVAGSYTVVASTPGAATSASFSLTNQVGSPASVTATGGTSQTAKIGTAFASPLVAVVKDSGGNLVSGAPVTFAVPGSGASGTFSGSATVTSDVNGVATAPAFTANTVAGSYTVVASTPGAATSASFSLTNQVGSPATITATGGTSQSTSVNTAFASLLVATVKDSGGNLVSGATVTFAAPVTGASGTFGGSVNVVTAANGTATAPVFTANGTAGSYAVTATVSPVPGSATFNLKNNAVVSGGSLSGAGDSSKTGAILSTEGGSDWIHWGDTSLNRKAGVTALISTYAAVGGGTVTKYSNDLRPLSWTGGTPTATSTNNLAGVYVSGTGKGFSITAPADLTTRTIVVHLGGWNSGGTLTAHLSDGSAVDFVDTTTSVSGQYDRNYTLTYQAGAAGQTLTVTWKMVSGAGNVTLNGAALQ